MKKLNMLKFGIACLSIFSMAACGQDTSSVTSSSEETGIQFTITLNIPDKYKDAGTVSGAGTYTYSKSHPIAISSKSNDGWKFDGWYLPDGTCYSNYISFRYTDHEDLTLEARWKEGEYDLTLKSRLADSYEALTGAGQYKWNDTVTVTCTPKEGYDFNAWTDIKGNILSTDLTYTFTMPAADTTLYVELSEHATNYGEGTYTRSLSYITMGSYPQTRIEDRETTTQYDAYIGELPTVEDYTPADLADAGDTGTGDDDTSADTNDDTSDDDDDTTEPAEYPITVTSSNAADLGWTDYGYYYAGVKTEYMWYKDFEYGNDKIRAVYFHHYRPFRNDFPNDKNPEILEDSLQFDYKYKCDKVYYFKWEPINWTVLTEGDGEAYLLSDVALDSQNFYHSIAESDTRTIHGNVINANNYFYSEIRDWLNYDFLNAAFTEQQQAIINFSQVDNTAASTNSNGDANDNICNDSLDQIFLLSYQEAKYTYFPTTEERLCTPTDYAKIQGAYYDSYYKSTYWMLRSPSCNNTTNVSGVRYDGKLGGYFAQKSMNAIRPAMKITL